MDRCDDCGDTSGCCECQVLEARAMICHDAERGCWADCDGIRCAGIFVELTTS